MLAQTCVLGGCYPVAGPGLKRRPAMTCIDDGVLLVDVSAAGLKALVTDLLGQP